MSPIHIPETLADELLLMALGRGQVVRMRGVGASMLPAIYSQDIVVARRESLEPGDIALAYLQEKWLAHRVVRIDSNGVLVRADNGGREDQIPHEAIHGRVIAVQRDLRGMRRRAQAVVMSRLNRLLGR